MTRNVYDAPLVARSWPFQSVSTPPIAPKSPTSHTADAISVHSWPSTDWFDQDPAMSSRIRRRLAGALVIVSAIAWPVTQLTVAKDEPSFILGLSWFAITLTALDIWATTDVRANDDEED